MWVIYGTKSIVKPVAANATGHCQVCGEHSSFHITHTYQRMTLYYAIPLFPFNKKTYAQCDRCGSYYTLEKKTAAAVRKGRQERLEPEQMTLVQQNAQTPSFAEAGGQDALPVEGSSRTANAQGTQRPPWVRVPQPSKPGSAMKGWGITLIVVGILMAILSVFTFRRYQNDSDRGGTRPINEMLQSGNLKAEQMVSVEVDAVLANYATETKNGRDTQYFIVWLDDDSLISLSTKDSSEIDKLNSVLDSTVSFLLGETEYLSGETVQLSGRLKEFSAYDSRQRTYFDETLEEMGIQATFNTSVRRFNIDCGMSEETTASFIVPAVIAAALLISGILLLVFGIKDAKAAKKKSDENNPIPEGMNQIPGGGYTTFKDE